MDRTDHLSEYSIFTLARVGRLNSITVVLAVQTDAKFKVLPFQPVHSMHNHKL